MSEMIYLRLIVGLTVLDCQRNCNILNSLKMDDRVTVTALQKYWLDALKQKNNIICTVHLVHFIVTVQKMHSTFNNNYLFRKTPLYLGICTSSLGSLCLLKSQTDKMETVKQVVVTVN